MSIHRTSRAQPVLRPGSPHPLPNQIKKSPFEPKRSVHKRLNGHLTDAGIDAVYADFAAATLSNEQLAEKHDISLSCVVNRKAMWKRGQR